MNAIFIDSVHFTIIFSTNIDGRLCYTIVMHANEIQQNEMFLESIISRMSDIHVPCRQLVAWTYVEELIGGTQYSGKSLVEDLPVLRLAHISKLPQFSEHAVFIFSERMTIQSNRKREKIKLCEGFSYFNMYFIINDQWAITVQLCPIEFESNQTTDSR